MMKFVAFLAVVVVAVSATYHFKQPKMPCNYKMTETTYEDGSYASEYIMERNGEYVKMTVHDGIYDYFLLFRPDIGEKDNVTVFDVEHGDCMVEEIEESDAAYLINIYSHRKISYVDDKDWDNKESKKWREKNCDHYYDDDDTMELYVYDDHIYGMVRDGDEVVVEYEWEAPMEDFALSKKEYPECYEKEEKVAKTPSGDCSASNPGSDKSDKDSNAASSIHVAFVAMFAALLFALF